MPTTVSWRELLSETTDRFSVGGVDDAEISARRIVEEASGWEGAELPLHLDEAATEKGVVRLDRMIERRLRGEPLQYVVGRWSFRMLDLMVDARALIPRPETEEVAGWAIDEARRFDEPVVVDLGTGTGAIGLSVALEIDTSAVVLTDVSDDALSVARANLAGLGRAAARVSISSGSWFEALPPTLRGAVDVIVSNPPYVTDTEPLPSVVQDWEPMTALRAGADGMRDLNALVDQSIEWLAEAGVLVLEMDPGQTQSVAERCRARGFADVDIRPDLSGRHRAVIARRS